MIINHNMNALNAHRNMGVNNTNAGKSMEKLQLWFQAEIRKAHWPHLLVAAMFSPANAFLPSSMPEADSRVIFPLRSAWSQAHLFLLKFHRSIPAVPDAGCHIQNSVLVFPVDSKSSPPYISEMAGTSSRLR